MTPEQLLSQISAIAKAYDQISKKTGGHFNIFQIANIASDERTICRVLHELLNPKGCHDQGDIYLALFVEKVLKLEHFELSSVEVFREYGTEENRRIDLAVKNASYFIPIEVKIHAKDQSRQCYDYAQLVKGESAKLYYLTLYGTPPSAESAAGLEADGKDSYKEVVQISFETDILEWLYACASHRATLAIAPIREVIFQLISTIRTLTGQLEEGKEMEMKELLLSSSEHLRSALAIESVIKESKIALLEKLFRALEDEFAKASLPRAAHYDKTAESVRDFYKQKASSYPSLTYMVKHDVEPGSDILLHVEVDHRLFFSFCMGREGKIVEAPKRELMQQHLPHLTFTDERWWPYWRYLPDLDVSVVPNFKEPNDPFFKLCDQDYFTDLIAKCVKIVTEAYAEAVAEK